MNDWYHTHTIHTLVQQQQQIDMANPKTNRLTFLILLSLVQHIFLLHAAITYAPKTNNSSNNRLLKNRTTTHLQSNASDPSVSPKTNKNIIAACFAGVTSTVVLLIIGFLIYRCYVRRRTAAAKERNQQGSDTCLHFSIEEIKAATNNFDKALIIGEGGFGIVYKGHIDRCQAQVAVKRLRPGSDQGAHEFRTEIEMLSQFRHPHLVSLIGYCNDNGEMILVYDFMARGTLRDHLYGSHQPLSWNRRLEICLQAARGINFLHTGVNKRSVIHRDVKSTNILLDENWVAKVSDFGLSRDGLNGSHVTTEVKGSLGYLDPEYYMSLWLSQKSDVYSFGVVLLEVLCGRPPIKSKVEEKHEEFLVSWFKRCADEGKLDRTVDPALKGSIRHKCFNKFVEVVLTCLDDHGKQRPLMRDVVDGLECAWKLQQAKKVQVHHHHQKSSSSKAREEEEALVLGLGVV